MSQALLQTGTGGGVKVRLSSNLTGLVICGFLG